MLYGPRVTASSADTAKINAVVTAIEAFLARYTGTDGLAPVDLYVRPSGDDTDVIKVWIDLGQPGVGADTGAWAKACEAAIRDAVPVGELVLQVRVEAGP